MTLLEAKTIATDNEPHATTTLDLAEYILRRCNCIRLANLAANKATDKPAQFKR